MNALTSPRFDRMSWLMVSSDRPAVRRRQSRRHWLVGLAVLAAVGAMTPGAIASIDPVRLDRSSSHSGTESLERPPLMVSQAAPTSTLRLGTSGDAVTTLQQSLADLGYYSGPITGYFGEQTEQAVREFQSSSGLTADGIAGSGTLSAIANARTPEATPGSVREGTTGDLVIALQERLTELGYYTGAVDGVFGKGTTAAVLRFQEQNGLVADGVVGAATEAALRSADAVPASAPTANQSSTSSSSAATPAPGSGVLRLGSSGREVIVLQSQLQALGYYSGEVDGNFGESTQAAVIKFQSEQGLVGDGLVGPQTTYLLDEQFFAMRSQDATPTAPQSPATTPSPQPNVAPSPSPSATAPTGVSPAPPMAFPGAVSPSSTPTPAPSAAVSVPTTPTVVPRPQPQQPALPPAAAAPAPAPAAPVRIAEQGSYAVLEIQQKLYQQGLYDGPLDGVMNPQIERAILEAQQEHGLSPTDLAP